MIIWHTHNMVTPLARDLTTMVNFNTLTSTTHVFQTTLHALTTITFNAPYGAG